ncbi:unnamed protein product [Prorocentrum cordatum]|uniref:Uncharacterized protein n=1 Tax=Prorocentrum cordatum TaxID=2364126 RepID=A0ABN9PRL5_9DINO|nr:unnamed protein product [Polarella glacialis]
MPTPLITTPVKVVDTANITINEYFGHVASKDGAASFALVDVHAADKAGFQTAAFAEFVICNSGAIDFEHSDGQVTRALPATACTFPRTLATAGSSLRPAATPSCACPPTLPSSAAWRRGAQL